MLTLGDNVTLCKGVLCKLPNCIFGAVLCSAEEVEQEIGWQHAAGREGQKCTSLGWSLRSQSIQVKNGGTAKIVNPRDPNVFAWKLPFFPLKISELALCCLHTSPELNCSFFKVVPYGEIVEIVTWIPTKEFFCAMGCIVKRIGKICVSKAALDFLELSLETER